MSMSDRLADHPTLKSIAGVLAVVGSIASGYFFVLIPLLTVPSPAKYLFYLAWLVPIGLSILWLRSHPWRALAVAAAATVLVIAVISAGSAIFGWAP